MFYNSKKLIDEKVLQQYYFERFMLADASERKKLLPEVGYEEYSYSKNIKVLHPEVNLGGSHKTDFVLYPMPNKGLNKRNIEIKWSKKDAENQPERFDFYNGKNGKGFIVCLYEECYKSEKFLYDRESNKLTDIPVVYLEIEPFKQWFSKNAYNIVSQALTNKLRITPSRLSGTKYWLITIVDDSFKHYMNHGRKNQLWAFRDNNNPKNIMQILENDYVVFVYFDSLKPSRMVYPYDNTPRMIKTRRGPKVNSKDISWSISLIDIFKVTKGYKLDFSSKFPFNGFDEEWMALPKQLPEDKNYTQFIRFSYDSNDYFQNYWDKPEHFSLDRSLFNSKNSHHVELVNAMRLSMNNHGDALELSREFLKLYYKYLIHIKISFLSFRTKFAGFILFHLGYSRINMHKSRVLTFKKQQYLRKEPKLIRNII